MSDLEKLAEPTLFKKLEKAAISTLVPSVETGTDYIIDGEPLKFETDSPAYICRILPEYHNNDGFFHLFQNGGECIFLKGVYSDNIRILKKGITLNGEILNRIARFLTDIENTLDTGCELWLLSTEHTDCIVKAKEYSAEKKLAIDPHIPRPLTGSEYSDGRTGCPDTTLFSRGFLHSLFPETVSQFTASVVKSYPEILSPFFLALDAKLSSPSLKYLNLRLYTNISSLLSGFKETHSDVSAFAADFMPWQQRFKDQKRQKTDLLISSMMSKEEIAAFIVSTDDEIKSRGNYAFFNADFFTPLSSISLIGVMLNFLFQEQVIYLAKLLNMTADEALSLVYKTRASSFFIAGAEFSIPEYFDPSYEQKELIISASVEAVDKNKILENLSPFKKWHRAKKIMQILELAHNTLDMRDTLLKSASKFHNAVRKAMINHGEYLVTKKRFLTKDEIFMFDINDIRRLVHDTYYSSLTPIITYKRGYRCRAAAQNMPYEIYEADIPYSGRISEEQLDKAMNQKIIPCNSRMHRENSGKIYMFGEETPANSIICSAVFSLPIIAALQDPKAVITDLAPAFSYISEYCILHNIPVYYGLRHSELLFKNRDVSLFKNEIHITGN